MTRHQQSPHSIALTVFIGGLLVSVFAAAGYFASHRLPEAVLTAIMKYAIGLVGVVWLFSLNVYNKLSDVTDLAGLDHRQHRNLEVEVRARLQWFWVRAFFLAVVALAMYSPSIYAEAKLPVPHWMFGLSSAAFALAMFSLRRLLGEMEEIRELRSYVKELERREKERSEKVKTLKDGLKSEWKSDEHLSGFRPPSESAEL